MENLIILENEEFTFLYKKSFYKSCFKQLEVVVCNKPYLEFHIEKHIYLLKGTMKSLADILPCFFVKISRNVFINIFFIENIIKDKSERKLLTIHGKSYNISHRRYQHVLSTVTEIYKTTGQKIEF